MGIAGKSGHAVRFFPKQFYCWGSQCCLRCVRLGWDAVSASLVLSLCCLRSCLRTCHPVPELGLQPGMLCPAPWSCLCLVSGLVSQLVSQLPGLVFVLSPNLSPSLFFSLGCCVRLLVLSLFCLRSCLPTSLVFSLGCCVRLLCFVFVLSPVLFPN